LQLNSIELIHKIDEEYLFPILKFADIVIDETGILRPANSNDPEIAYTDEDRVLIIPNSYAEFMQLKNKKEQFEVFNPLNVPRQCVFLANMVMNACNKMNGASENNLVYDEDLDEWIEDPKAKKVNKIAMFHMRDTTFGINNRIVFSKVDESGNPIGEPESSYVHCDILVATYGAIVNLIKKFAGNILGPKFLNTNKLVCDVLIEVQKYKKEKEKERGDKSPDVEIQSESEEDNIVDDQILELDDIEYAIDPEEIPEEYYFGPFDKTDMYKVENEYSRLTNGMIFPTFKTVTYDTKEEEMVDKIIKLQEFDEYADIVFDD